MPCCSDHPARQESVSSRRWWQVRSVPQRHVESESTQSGKRNTPCRATEDISEIGLLLCQQLDNRGDHTGMEFVPVLLCIVQRTSAVGIARTTFLLFRRRFRSGCLLGEFRGMFGLDTRPHSERLNAADSQNLANTVFSETMDRPIVEIFIWNRVRPKSVMKKT